MSNKLEVQWRASNLLNKILTEQLRIAMSVKEYKQEALEETENTHQGLRLITGGKPPANIDWLGEMEHRTVFLVHPKKLQGAPYAGYGLAEFTHGGKFGRAVLLVEDASSANGKFTWVISRKFSEDFELYEIVHKPDD